MEALADLTKKLGNWLQVSINKIEAKKEKDTL
jgi:hypothetical protein